jgi:hypothetical protein
MVAKLHVFFPWDLKTCPKWPVKGWMCNKYWLLQQTDYGFLSIVVKDQNCSLIFADPKALNP